MSPCTAWTGERAFIWGGWDELDDNPNADWDGALYDPSSDRWEPVSNVGTPAHRAGCDAFWTGSAVLVFGGYAVPGDGGSYDPESDTWSLIAAPPDGRTDTTNAWSGSELLAWASDTRGVNDGYLYSPVLPEWRAMTGVGAPLWRSSVAACWTGEEMMVLGGVLDGSRQVLDGGLYDPSADRWRLIEAPLPEGTRIHQLLPLGDDILAVAITTAEGLGPLIVLRFHPASQTWSEILLPPEDAPTVAPSVAWTGSEVLIWGAVVDEWGDEGYSVGFRYSPTLDRWSGMSNEGAPSPRFNQATVWTGEELIVWGGRETGGMEVATGARYLP